MTKRKRPRSFRRSSQNAPSTSSTTSPCPTPIGGSPSCDAAFAPRPLRGITHCCYFLGIGCYIPFVGYSCCKVLRSFLFISQSVRDRRLLFFVFNLGLWKGHLRLPISLPCILQLMVPALEPLQHPHPLLLRWWIKVINEELQHCLVG